MANDTESQFVIPEAAFASIRQLVDMRPDDFDAFILGLAAAKPSPTSAGLACYISKQAPNVSESVINSIVDEILTLESVKNDTDLSVEDFIDNIVHAAVEAKSDKFPFSEADSDCLKVRLERIFDSDHALALLEKVVTVLTDHTHLFLSSKVLTDARPVFNDDATEIEAIAIVHTLRIHFEHNQKHEDFFVALDTSDVRKLSETLDRAEAKADLLRRTLSATNVNYLDIEPPHDHD